VTEAQELERPGDADTDLYDYRRSALPLSYPGTELQQAYRTKMLLLQSERSKLGRQQPAHGGRQQPAHGECRLSGSRLRRESPTVCCCKGAAHATPNTCCCHGWLGSGGQQLGCSGSIHLRRLRPGADSRFPLQSSDRQSLFKSHDSQSKHGSVELLHVSPATDRSSRAGSSSSTTGESDPGSARSDSAPGSR
jgi:hypothetical protein